LRSPLLNGLEFMGKEWDNIGDVRKANRGTLTNMLNADGKPKFQTRAPAFDLSLSSPLAMQQWHADWLHACFRVLVPGGRLLAFGGSRVYHRMAAAFDDVGFVDVGLEAWNYGSGFPKSMSIGKALDRTAGKTTDDIRCLKRELQRVFALSNLTLVQLNEGCGFEASGYLRESSTWVTVLPSPEKWWRMREVIGCDAEFEFTFRAAERAVVGESPWSNSVNHFVPGENHLSLIHI
jgi:hypothetical protein